MKIIISPAKSLDYRKPVPVADFTMPRFLDRSERLVDALRQLHPAEIGSLMSISSKLAELNFERFQQWHQPFTLDNARQAVYAFDGDVYDGLDVRSLNDAQVGYLGQHLRILSGLYGVLRPLDIIQPYRLEMGSKLSVDGAKNLYQFWGLQITDSLNDELAAEADATLVNLASEEYFKSIITASLNARIVTPVFMEYKGDKPRVVALMAKRARGMMVRFMAEQAIGDVEDLKTFDYGRYAFSPDLSEGDRWVFVR